MVPQSEKSQYTCDQEGCPLKSTGLCLEGLAIKECPHSSLQNTKTALNVDKSTELVRDKNLLLFLGEELQDTDLPTITLAFPTKLILIFGEVNSGKTTLLASLYDLFQKGPFAGYWFAGSRTQIGFERRCHLARFGSSKKGDTERTKSVDFSYLHLSLKEVNSDEPIQHLLLSDVSGERFKLARDSQEEMKRLTILSQADKVFYIVDGDQVTNLALRHSAKHNLIKLLDRILQSELLNPAKGIHLLVTKWDLVKSRGQESDVENFLIQPLKKKFNSFICQTDYVCARAYSDAEIESGMGLDTFLEICLENSDKPQIEVMDNKNLLIEREFNRFALH